VSRSAELDGGFGPDLDPDTIERLLARGLHPDDAPPRYRDAARTLHGLRSPASVDELSGESIAVRRAVVLLDGPPAIRARPTRRGAMTRGRLATAIVAGTLVATSGAAAANVLPQPLERQVSHLLSHVGISVRTPPTDRPGTVPVSPARRPTDRPEVSERPSMAPARGRGHGAAVSAAASDGRSRAGRRVARRRSRASTRGAAMSSTRRRMHADSDPTRARSSSGRSGRNSS